MKRVVEDGFVPGEEQRGAGRAYTYKVAVDSMWKTQELGVVVVRERRESPFRRVDSRVIHDRDGCTRALASPEPSAYEKCANQIQTMNIGKCP
jgi:hypothetical protein